MKKNQLTKCLYLINQIATMATSSHNLDEILQLVTKGLADIFNVKQVEIALFDEANEHLVVYTEYLSQGSVSGVGDKIPLKGNRQIARIQETCQPIILDDIENDPDVNSIREVIKQRKTLSLMIAPVFTENKMVGTISIGSTDKKKYFNPEDAELAQAIAKQTAIVLQNSKQLENRLNDIRALRDITEYMHYGGFQKILNSIAEQAVELTSAKYGGIWLLNKTGTALEVGGLAGVAREKAPLKTLSLTDDIEKSIFKKVVQEKKTYLCSNVSEDENYLEWYQDTRSQLTVPLLFREQTIGIINVESIHPNSFIDDDMRLLEAMAGQTAIVVQNARLIEQLEALEDIGIALSSGTDLQEIVRAIYEQVKQLTGIQDMYIALYNEATEEIRFPLAIEKGERVQYSPRKADMEKRGKTEEIIFTKKSILHKTKEEAEEWYRPNEHGEFVDFIIPSWLGVPMIVGERVLGVIAVYDLEHEFAFDEQDLQVFSSMANQAAFSLVNLELNRRNFALTSLIDIGVKLTSGIRMQENQILELVFAEARKLTSALDLYIALYNEDSSVIDFVFAIEKGEWVNYPSRQANMDQRGKTEEIIFTRYPILHKTRREADEWYAQSHHGEFIGHISPSWLGVPMMTGNKVLGVIAAFDLENEYAYDEFHLDVLSSMAAQTAIALENARLYEAAREEVVAAKQLSTLGTAIAALQHRINNTFNIIIPNVTRLRSRVDLSDPVMVEILDIIERNVRYTSNVIARIQEPLKEVEITDVNINAILDSVILDRRELWNKDVTRLHMSIIFEPDENVPIIRGPSGQIAEVFDNLLGNAYKAMPKGGEIRVKSELNNGIIYIKVIDSGFGISDEKQKRLFKKPVPSKEPGAGAGLGLWLSQLMLQSIGGSIEVEDSSTEGTTMLVKIPTQSFN